MFEIGFSDGLGDEAWCLGGKLDTSRPSKLGYLPRACQATMASLMEHAETSPVVITLEMTVWNVVLLF